MASLLKTATLKTIRTPVCGCYLSKNKAPAKIFQHDLVSEIIAICRLGLLSLNARERS